MCSSASLRRHVPWQLAVLHSFAIVSLKAAPHEHSFRDFRLTLRGLAATTSLLFAIHVADSSSRVRMWRHRFVQVHVSQICLRNVIETFRFPHNTYLLLSAASSNVQEDQTTAACFSIQKEVYVGCTTCTVHVINDKMQDYASTDSYSLFNLYLVNSPYIGFIRVTILKSTL